MRKLALSLLCAATLLLPGCRSIFDAEYVVDFAYDPPRTAVESALHDDPIGDLAELRDVLLAMVEEGETQRRITFDASYAGDLSADLAAACWQVRTQDALCAYCVETISYEVSRILNHNEATVSVGYSAAADDVESIVQLPYAADARKQLSEAMERGARRLVLLIERSSYTEDNMVQLARQIYREHPAIAPREPTCEVTMFSGAETQRLYEIELAYGFSEEELEARRQELAAVQLFSGIDTASLSEAERAMLACSLLCVHSSLCPEGEASSIYDALVLGRADSLGLSYAYTELCRSLGLRCLTVFGQRNWEEHNWNLVEVEGNCYHVDMAACEETGLATGFLLNDEAAWGRYRWDYFSYPHCEGTIRFQDIAQAWLAGRG